MFYIWFLIVTLLVNWASAHRIFDGSLDVSITDSIEDTQTEKLNFELARLEGDKLSVLVYFESRPNRAAFAHISVSDVAQLFSDFRDYKSEHPTDDDDSNGHSDGSNGNGGSHSGHGHGHEHEHGNGNGSGPKKRY